MTKPSDQEIRSAKEHFLRDYMVYADQLRIATAHVGQPLALYLHPEIDAQRQLVNKLAAWLRENDPEFPTTWVNL